MSSFALKPGKSIRRQLKRIVRKQLDRASERLLHDGRDDDACARKPQVRQEGRGPGEAPRPDGFSSPSKEDPTSAHGPARLVAAPRPARCQHRDIQSFAVTICRTDSQHTARVIRTRLTRQKTTITRRAHAGTGSLARSGKALQELRRSAKKWVASSIDLSEFPQVLGRSFREGRKAMKRAQLRGRTPDFHNWRKRVKNLWYQLRLAERLVVGLTTQIEEFRNSKQRWGRSTILRCSGGSCRERGLRS